MVKQVLARFIAFSLAVLIILQSVGSAAARNIQQLPKSGFHILESTDAGLTLELIVPNYVINQTFSDRGPCQTIQIAGWGQSGQPGEPALPIKGAMVGVPAGSVPQINIFEANSLDVFNGIDLCPAATSIESTNPEDDFQDLGETLQIDTMAYMVNDEFPGTLALLGPINLIRSQQVARVILQPFQYNPVTRQLSINNHLKVRVDFKRTNTILPRTKQVDEGPFESVLRAQLINYDAARAWRIPPSSIQINASPSAVSPAYKLAVSQNGMVRLTYSTLQSSGLPVGNIDPRTFQIKNQGNEISIMVAGETDGTFDPEDYIVFYGQKVNTRFTDTNIYWVTWGGSNGLRMNTADGSPGNGIIPDFFYSTVHREENKSYQISNPSGLDNNRWYWDAVNLPTIGPKTYIIDLSNLSGMEGVARIRGLFKGYSANPQHHVHISINDNLVLETFWPAREAYSFDVEIPQSFLVNGSNTIKVECPLTDGITQNTLLVDWFEVDYTKTFAVDGSQTLYSGDTPGDWKFSLTGFNSDDLFTWDITNTENPIRILNGSIEESAPPYSLVFEQDISSKRQYLTASPDDLPSPSSISLAQAVDLHSSANGADYILISHPDFLSAVQPLADFHTQQGMRVKIINILDIYDEFNAGVFDPNAIHIFLEYAYDHWTSPSPAYVLLVGDGNYDFKNFFLRNEPNYIPPFLAEVDPWMGETAADNRFVTVSGNDNLPDMALGRLPVKTPSEASAIIGKILDYSQNSHESWIKKTLFVAGNYDPSAGDFAGLTDNLIDTYLAQQSTFIDKMYFMIHQDNGASAREAIVNAINDGRGLVHFSGHSNPYAWFGDFNIPNANDTILIDRPGIKALSNTNKYPIIISMTCYTGYYIQPSPLFSDLSSLDEVMIKATEKGAVATWSPTGKGVASGHDLLDAGLFDALYKSHITMLGSAINLAKYYLYASGSGHEELIDTYSLFGDPALRVSIELNVYLPVINR